MDTVPCVAFGTLLRRYRVAAGLTQEELAERAGLSRRSLGDMERGVARTPRQDTVALLAAALALAPQERSAFVEAARRLGAPDASIPVSPSPSAPPFVGRARELALLERHLAGEGPPLLVAGEPGIGKTRLLHAAIPRALVQGFHVLEGAASGGAATRPMRRFSTRCSATSVAGGPPSCARTCATAPGWCACCPSWPTVPSRRCPPGPYLRSRSGG